MIESQNCIAVGSLDILNMLSSIPGLVRFGQILSESSVLRVYGNITIFEVTRTILQHHLQSEFKI